MLGEPSPRASLGLACAVSMGLSACIGQAPSAVPAGREGELVSAWTGTEPGWSGTGLYLRNNTSRGVRVLSVTLEACAAIREECRRYDEPVLLEPGESRRLMSVHPEVAGEAFDFRWTFDWEYVDGGDSDAS